MEHIFKVKIRLDYMSFKSNKGFFSRKNIEDAAEELRQNKVASLRNVPMQGVTIEDIEMNLEVFTLVDEVTGRIKAFAPVNIVLVADSLEDIIPLVMLDEFRTVQVLAPEEINFTHLHIEKLLFAINGELSGYRSRIERKLENWK